MSMIGSVFPAFIADMIAPMIVINMEAKKTYTVRDVEISPFT